MRNFSELIRDYIRKKQEEKNLAFCARSWLDSAAKRASQISIATHILKYTHSEARGTNLFVKTEEIQEKCREGYLSTSSLHIIKEDAVGNAAALDVAGLLGIELNGVILLDLIAKDDSTSLAPFAEDDAQLQVWMVGFKSVLSDNKLASHTFAKQVYFPVGKNEYHLLAPLYSSSLTQALYERVIEDRFGEKAKEARECKRKDKLSDAVITDYPNLAIQKFGGTKPQNISRLNSKRGGKSFLLRNAPPRWKAIKKPPILKNAFWGSYGRSVSPILREFRQFLLSVQDCDNKKDIRDRREDYINQLLDYLVQIAAEIQGMAGGWSKDSELTTEEHLWLDPKRSDKDFQEMRMNEDWKKSVSNRFATWIIQKLEYKKMRFDDSAHLELYGKCMETLKAVSQ